MVGLIFRCYFRGYKKIFTCRLWFWCAIRCYFNCKKKNRGKSWK